ncbi:MAG: drug/metabolite exporter YedA [Acidobacteriota bacterium]
MTASFRFRLIAALAAVYVVWGSTYLAILIAIETLPGFAMAGVRFLSAGALLYAARRWAGDPPPTRSQWQATAIIGGLLLMGGNGGVVWAEHYVPSGIAAVIVATLPLWMALLRWLVYKEGPPNRPTTWGIAMGLAGVLLLAWPSLFPAEGMGEQGLYLPAVVVLLGACLSWAIGSLYSREADLPSSAWMTTAAQMLTGGAMLMVLSTVSGEWQDFDAEAVSLRSILALGYLVIFGAIIAYSAYIWLLRNADATLASTYAYVNPVIALALGWMLANETLSARDAVAASLIVAAVALVSRSSTAAPSEAEDETSVGQT